MTPRQFSFLMFGGVANRQRIGPFDEVPPEIRIPHEVERPLLIAGSEWKVDRYWPSLFSPGAFCWVGTVKPNRREAEMIRKGVTS